MDRKNKRRKVENKNMKIKIAIAIALTALMSLTAQAQYTAIPLPFTTLAASTANVVSNLSAGWSVITTNTQITTYWSNSIAALVTATNTTTSTNTVYADFSAVGQTIVPIQHEMATSAGLSNVILHISRSVNGIYYPTNVSDSAVTIVTNTSIGTARKTATWPIDMTGYEYGRIIWFTYADSGNANTLTNLSLIKGNKRQLK